MRALYMILHALSRKNSACMALSGMIVYENLIAILIFKDRELCPTYLIY